MYLHWQPVYTSALDRTSSIHSDLCCSVNAKRTAPNRSILDYQTPSIWIDPQRSIMSVNAIDPVIEPGGVLDPVMLSKVVQNDMFLPLERPGCSPNTSWIRDNYLSQHNKGSRQCQKKSGSPSCSYSLPCDYYSSVHLVSSLSKQQARSSELERDDEILF